MYNYMLQVQIGFCWIAILQTIQMSTNNYEQQIADAKKDKLNYIVYSLYVNRIITGNT